MNFEQLVTEAVSTDWADVFSVQKAKMHSMVQSLPYDDNVEAGDIAVYYYEGFGAVGPRGCIGVVHRLPVQRVASIQGRGRVECRIIYILVVVPYDGTSLRIVAADVSSEYKLKDRNGHPFAKIVKIAPDQADRSLVMMLDDLLQKKIDLYRDPTAVAKLIPTKRAFERKYNTLGIPEDVKDQIPEL